MSIGHLAITFTFKGFLCVLLTRFVCDCILICILFTPRTCDSAFILVEKTLSENLLLKIFIVQVSEVEVNNGGGSGAFCKLGGRRTNIF